MIKKVNLNKDWTFEKQGVKSTVDLPHTWNAEDGQNGEKGYYQGKCVYSKTIEREDGEMYLEINGANSVCEVFVNGQKVCTHKGGYSMFRCRIDNFLSQQKNTLSISVDNTVVSDVFPTSADFTFYGGLYRDVNLITAKGAHFDLTDGSRHGITAVPHREGDIWILPVKANVSNAGADSCCVYTLKDADGKTVASETRPSVSPDCELRVSNPVLWNGRENPYLYDLECEICENSVTSDKINIEIGFREITFDKDKGCFLNGRHIKLKGVSRHQDRENIGNALTLKEHKEDVELILDIGANSVRLAHYQQAEEFYSLCDRAGLLVWAEVPVITIYSKARQQNAEEQLVSLIKQNINHPCIFCWGIQNEITLSGERNKALIKGLNKLNDIAHTLDPSRVTTCAQVSMAKPESEMNNITDILGYNHYFGWYMQTCCALDKWLDDFRKAQPDAKLCLSEYGAEAVLGYYSENPVQGDYSEGYQAIYHEHYIDAINSRDHIWGSYVWNMFDFGSAARNEGGVRGRNNKGLVTIDRKTKKDAFYLYKATWSDEKFVYITQKRYPVRVVGSTKIKVYSNMPEVTLRTDGYEKTVKADRVFVFDDVPVKEGENKIEVFAGMLRDCMTIEGKDRLPASYAIGEGVPTLVRNWFGTDGTFKPDCLSIEDRVGTLLDNEEAIGLLRLAAGNHIGKWYVKILRPFKVKTLLRIAGISEQTRDLVNGFLQTVKKKG